MILNYTLICAITEILRFVAPKQHSRKCEIWVKYRTILLILFYLYYTQPIVQKFASLASFTINDKYFKLHIKISKVYLPHTILFEDISVYFQ